MQVGRAEDSFEVEAEEQRREPRKPLRRAFDVERPLLPVAAHELALFVRPYERCQPRNEHPGSHIHDSSPAQA